jgi:hypothetical protein
MGSLRILLSSRKYLSSILPCPNSCTNLFELLAVSLAALDCRESNIMSVAEIELIMFLLLLELKNYG